MRVLLFTSSMGAGGAERVASTLVNAWAARGNRVALMPTFSGGGRCAYPLAHGVELVMLASLVPNRRRDLTNRLMRLRQMRAFIARWQPDVIVSFLSNVNVAAVAASTGTSVPIIVSERNDPFAQPTPPLLKIGCRIAYPLADALVVQTEAVAEKYARSRWPWGRVRVIPNPVSPATALPSDRGDDGGRKVVLAVGRLSEQKHFDVLIDVFGRLVGRFPRWSLRIVGEGPLRGALERQIDEIGLSGRAELPGQTASIEREFAAADVFALTSRYEGFPNALLEAMVAGLPCVTFDCPSGPREMSRDGDVALLIPPDRDCLEGALSTLMSDETLRRSLGGRARASAVERYALERVLERWDALFTEIGVPA